MKKLRKYSALRKEAQRVFNRWIVNRDRVCITCGRPAEHAGHFIHRNCYDFNEQILHGQCAYCNTYLHGNLGVYAMKMIELYGFDNVEEMHRQSHEIVKFSREFLEEVIRKYSFDRSEQ